MITFDHPVEQGLLTLVLVLRGATHLYFLRHTQ